MKHLMKRTWLAALGLGLVLASPPALDAQRIAADTSLAAVVEGARSWGGLLVAARILKQHWGPESPERLDALADSLVATVAAYRPGDGVSKHNAALTSLLALTTAARSEGRGRAPYSGAFDALRRVAEESEDVGFQAVALGAMPELPDTSPVPAYLRSVALSDRSAAQSAIGALAALGPEGVAILRELHHEDLVEHRRARFSLHLFADRQGWEPRLRLSDCKVTVRRLDRETGELGEPQCLNGPPTAGGGG